MVELKNIVETDNEISFDCYPDGIKENKREVVIDKNTLEIKSGSIRDMYMGMAIQKIRKYIRKGIPLPKELLSVWY